jgi:hypothetical protein
MSADPSQVELTVSRDDRLIAAVETVVAHAGERAGLSAQEQAELITATEGACEETFSRATRNGTRNPALRIVVSDFPGRVEVLIEENCGSRSSTARAGSAAFPTAQPDAVSAGPGEIKIDRLHSESQGGQARILLVKHHSTAKPHPHR